MKKNKILLKILNGIKRVLQKKKILTKKIQSELRNKIIKYVKKKIILNFPEKKLQNFKLSNYHKYLDKNDHYKFLKIIGNGIKFKDISFKKEKIEKALSSLLKINVTTKNKNSKKINPETFALRIIRPGKNDFNPPHKDVYLKRLKNAVNIYMPVLGSNSLSSLPLLPQSHYLNEKDIIRTKNGAIVNKVKFRVPCIVSTKIGLHLVRPNPSLNEILIFSPYLIHGGGYNDNKDTTRISLELRFWKR